MPGRQPTHVTFFARAADFRKWLKRNHALADELWVGFYRKNSNRPSISWPESVDEALCVGWIDGIRKKVDEISYAIRFTPRRAGSVWSSINIGRAEFLLAEGRMLPAGRIAFGKRLENRSGIYAYEQQRAELPEPFAGRLRKHKRAWEFFQSQPPFYRKMISWWVVSAKKDETRSRRLHRLIEACRNRERL